LLIRIEKEKELVFDNRPADIAAKLVTFVLRFDWNGRGGCGRRLDNRLERVKCTEITATIKPEGLAVQTIRARLRDCICDAAGGTAILSRIVRRINLKLANRRLAYGIAYASASLFLGEEGLIVIAPIDGVVV